MDLLQHEDAARLEVVVSAVGVGGVGDRDGAGGLVLAGVAGVQVVTGGDGVPRPPRPSPSRSDA